MTLVELLPWLTAMIFFLLWVFAGLTLASEREDRLKERQGWEYRLKHEVAAALKRGVEADHEPAPQARQPSGFEQYLDSIKPADLLELNDPEPITCAECRESFTTPELREPDDDLKMLDYHCPYCHWKYARFPKCS